MIRKGNILWTSSQFVSDYTGVAADTYVWQKKGTDILVLYVDEQRNKLGREIISGIMGELYSTSERIFDGYTLKKVVGETKGIFTSENKKITYIYRKNSELNTDTNTNTKPNTNKTQVVYRVYNPNTGEHFYPTSTYERDANISAGWKNEGILENAPTSGTAVYRVYNPNAKGGYHYYTTSQYEAKSLVSKGWEWDNDAKPVFYSGRSKAVYVAYNPNADTGAHNYTMNSFEQNSLLSVGWKYGKTAWFAVK
ncbi:hypothetical protein EFK69_07960 [Lactococcus lactis subsp. lactis]|nr:hypothetical protein [Lactococcus lactis subsp. lactis]